MEVSPSLNSSIRTILIAAGAVGVSKGWWDQGGLETMVDQLIVWGGATLVLVSGAWGIYAKWPRSSEAKVITSEVMSERAKDS